MQASVDVIRADMEKSRAWAGRFVATPEGLPIFFTLDGRQVRGIPSEWSPSTVKRRIDANITETVFEGREPRTGLVLRAECVQYSDYPVVEWTAWLTNSGQRPTPLISDILAMDGTFDGEEPRLWHCTGDYNSAEGYAVRETPLPEGETLAFAPSQGRPCDRAFPYYRILFAGSGLSIAIGWPGQWSASFEGGAGGVRLRAGQERTRLRLRPGETIRTPRMTIMSWTGDGERAANLWRRWHRAHLLPRPNGRPLRPLLSGHGTVGGDEFTEATTENQIHYIGEWARRDIPIDVWWIDAGWYPCYRDGEKRRDWPVTGTWKPDPERFPDGMAPVSECAARHGADLLVWFEPERLRPSSQIAREHPEWLLKIPDGIDCLLNLGIPACRQWLTDHYCRLIKDNGIRIYRQDHNFEPLDYWRSNEPEDRQGMNENLHVQGYLRFWDDLLTRNPGLWIDSCASGGRRNDLETMRRSVPLHYSDYGYGEHPVKLAFHHVLFEWFPYFKEPTLSWDLDGVSRYDTRVDSFSYHCGMGPMLMPCIDINRGDYDFDLMRRMIGIWRRAAEVMLNGDYHPLTEIHRSPHRWVALQFDLPEEGRGYIQAIRLPTCPDASLVAHPRNISADATYGLENPETGERREVKGVELLRDGLVFTLPPRQGAIWFYTVR